MLGGQKNEQKNHQKHHLDVDGRCDHHPYERTGARRSERH